MKTTFLFLICLFFSVAGKSQNIKIIYKEQLNVNTSQIDDPHIAAMVEEKLKESSHTTVLYCNKGESCYKQIAASLNQIGTESYIYKNIQNNTYKSEAYIFEKQFLIIDTLEKFDWKLSDEEKIIKKVNCNKAKLEDGTVAWYAPEIPVPDGPLAYWGLPGLILEINTKSKDIVCSNIELNNTENDLIAPPRKGKKISKEEFKDLVNKKKKQLGGQGLKQGQVNIIQLN